MKQSKYSDAQIMSILNQAEGGVPVSELCRAAGRPTQCPPQSRSPLRGRALVFFNRLVPVV